MHTRVILIRHGETDWNKQRRYLSFTDVDINDTGKGQILSALEVIKNECINRVYASDRKRALTSAGLLFKGIDIESTSDLREMDFGIFEGLRHEEIIEKHKDIYEHWIDDPKGVTIPEGESYELFRGRVMKRLECIAVDNPLNSVAVVTHGGVIRLILSEILKVRLWDVRMVKPAAVTVIEQGKDLTWEVKRYEPEGDIWPKK